MTHTPETPEEVRARRIAEFLARFGKPILLALCVFLTATMIALGLQDHVTAAGRSILAGLWFSILFPILLIEFCAPGMDR